MALQWLAVTSYTHPVRAVVVIVRTCYRDKYDKRWLCDARRLINCACVGKLLAPQTTVGSVRPTAGRDTGVARSEMRVARSTVN